MGRIAAGTALVGSIFAGAVEADVRSAESIWPDNTTSVQYVDGAEMPADPEEAGETRLELVLGGLGQVRPKAAAEQIAEAKKAAGENVAVAYVTYKNQGLYEDDAFGRADYEVLEAFLEQNNVKRIGIVGISMGLPIALEWLSSIVADAEAEGRTIDWRIEEIISYSSPYDAQDPWKSDLLRAGAKSKYPGGLFTKFLYNLDWGRVFDVAIDPQERLESLKETIKKTFNECSPKLFTSQARLLAEADPREWIPLLKKYADGVVFIYMIGELPDNVLDAEQAADRYFELLSELGNATLRLIVVAGAGHANTYLSAVTLGQVLQQEQLQEQDQDEELVVA